MHLRLENPQKRRGFQPLKLSCAFTVFLGVIVLKEVFQATLKYLLDNIYF